MNISRNGTKLINEEFSSERELQDILNDNSYLLLKEDESTIRFISHEVTLPDGQRLDSLLVDEQGVLIFTEVKLSRNGESRRKVFGQLIDYAATLTDLTIDELDDIVGGSLKDILFEFNNDGSLWRTCAANLRAGVIKLVILIDEANSDLKRIFKYFNDHIDLDTRLVEISKFNDNGDLLYVPNIIDDIVDKSKNHKTLNEHNAVLTQITTLYNEKNNDDRFKIKSKSKKIRQIKPWSNHGDGLHYELYPLKHIICVDLHLELDYDNLPEYLNVFAKSIIQNQPVVWDSKWFNSRKQNDKRGRLTIQFPIETDPSIIANALYELIQLTKDALDEYINQLN